jgi:hypothetical protein
MEHKLDQTVALFSRTPATLNALLRDLPAGWRTGMKARTPRMLSRLSAIC